MKAFSLLRAAAAIYDNPATELACRARGVRGFAGGADWMRRALGIVRGGQVPEPASLSFTRLGYGKYAAAFSIALVAGVIGRTAHLPWWCMLWLCPAAFYTAEVQWVFLFPAAFDHPARPWRMARRVTRNIGTVRAMGVVIPIAAVMLAGGWLGGGFVRSWCLGCLAIVLWYEEERSRQRQCGRSGCEVRVEKVGTGKIVARVLWAPDLHLNRWTALTRATELCRLARALKPDQIVLGGDLVDDQRAVATLARMTRLLVRVAPTHAFPGNHDAWLGIQPVRDAVTDGGGHWHEAPGFAIQFETNNTRVVELTSTVSSLKGAVLFVHDPAHIGALPDGWRAALAGHLHGGQAVFWTWRGREYPGAWISRWNGPRFNDQQGRTVLVSRGIADTLPVRWNCPREVILCEICGNR